MKLRVSFPSVSICIKLKFSPIVIVVIEQQIYKNNK